AAVTFDIPGPKRDRVARAILGGWGLDTIFNILSAPPVELLASTSVNLNGSVQSIRPNVITGIPFYLYGTQYAGGKIINNTIPTAAQVAAAGCVPLAPVAAPTNAKGAFCT